MDLKLSERLRLAIQYGASYPVGVIEEIEAMEEKLECLNVKTILDCLNVEISNKSDQKLSVNYGNLVITITPGKTSKV